MVDYRGTRYDIDAFQELQAECRADALKKLETIISKIQAIVERVCTDVARRARPSEEDEEEKVGGEGERVGGWFLARGPCVSLRGGGGGASPVWADVPFCVIPRVVLPALHVGSSRTE